MPRAIDASLLGNVQLPLDRNPLDRISYQPGKSLFDIDAFIEQIRTFIEDYLFPVIEDLTGIDLAAFLPTIEAVFDALSTLFGDLNPLSGTFDPLDAVTTFIELMVSVGANLPMALIEELTGFTGGVPILSQLIGLFTGTTGGLTGLGGLGAIFGDLTGLLGNPTALGSGAPELGSLNSIPLLGPIITGLLDGGQGVNTLNLFGQLPTSLFGLIPASAIGGSTPNLLNNGGFDGSISMDGSGVWVWDSTTGHTTNGAAKATANGTLKALLSNAVDVTPGQVLSPSAWVKTASYTGTGTPIRLAVRTYLNGAQVSTATITSIAGPGSTWTQMTGSYTVPAGVNQVRLRLVVDTTATAGSVWFDDATLTKPGNGPFDGILDLFGLGALDDLFGLDVSAIWTAIISDIISPLNLLFGVGDSIPDTNIPGIGSILDELFGGINLLSGITGASHTQAQDAITGQASTLVTTNATVAQILAALGPGNADADDFERTASTPGTKWDLYSSGSGTVGTPNGHDLSVGGSADFEYVMRRNTSIADDDGMISAIVLGTAPEEKPFLLPSEFGCNDVWIRLGTFTTWATRTGVRLRYQATKQLSVVAFNSGVATTIMSPTTIAPPTAGSTLSIESVGATRQFMIRCGGYSTAVTEVGTASQVGAAFRGRGLGGRTENTLFSTAHPGTTKQWTGQG